MVGSRNGRVRNCRSRIGTITVWRAAHLGNKGKASCPLDIQQLDEFLHFINFFFAIFMRGKKKDLNRSLSSMS
jgi:hypothetical protein